MSLYVSINAKAMAYILVVPKNKEEGDPTNVDIIKMGSRLLATCETHLMEPVNVGRCILFFLEQCPDLLKNVGKLYIYTTDQWVQNYFVDKYHSQHFDELDGYNYEFIQIREICKCLILSLYCFPEFIFVILKWYFVTKIVLTYCEKKMF